MIFFKIFFHLLTVHKSIKKKTFLCYPILTYNIFNHMYIQNLLKSEKRFARIFLLVTSFQLDVLWWYRTYMLPTKQCVLSMTLIINDIDVNVVIMVRSILILVSYARFLGEVSGYYTNYANAAFVKRIMRTGFIWGRFSCVANVVDVVASPWSSLVPAR